MENKEACKWCSHCNIYILEENKGTCYMYVKGVRLDDLACCDYEYDDDLERYQNY